MFDQKYLTALIVIFTIAGTADAKLYIKNDTGKNSHIERIFGGHAVDIQTVPYQVSINSADEGLCGGSIISPSHILTAAHCLESSPNKPRKFWVRSGSSYSDHGGVVSKISQMIIHENFTVGDIISNDIAILVLEEPLKFDNYTQQIQRISKNPRHGEEALISGWGLIEIMTASPVLLAVRVPVTTEIDRCQREAGKICTVSPRKIGACIGDSGGPVVVGGFLAAVVSEGDPRGCGIPNSPDLSSSVAYFKDWIERKMAETTGSQTPKQD